MADFTYSKRSPGVGVPFNFFNPDNIVQPRAPTSLDRAELSTLWLQPRDSAGTPVDSVWMCTNPGVWTLLTNAGGAGIFTSLSVSPGPTSILGVTVINGAGAGSTLIGGGSNTGPLTLGWVGNSATTLAGATVGIDSAAAGGVSIGNLILTTGDIAIGGSLTSGDISIGGTGAATGIIDIAPGTGAQTVNIAASTGVKTVNIATGAAASTTTIGSSTAGNLTVLASPITQLPGPVNIYTGAGAPANGLALHIGDLYIRTDAGGPTERMYIAIAVGSWTNVTCAA